MNFGTLKGSRTPREGAAVAKPPTPHAFMGAYRRPSPGTNRGDVD
jgi:hypothetical protein